MRSETLVCCCSISGIVISKPAEIMDIRLWCLLCVVWVAVCATGWSMVQRSLKGCVCVCVPNCVWSRNLNNEVAWAKFGLFSHGTKLFPKCNLLSVSWWMAKDFWRTLKWWQNIWLCLIVNINLILHFYDTMWSVQWSSRLLTGV